MEREPQDLIRLLQLQAERYSNEILFRNDKYAVSYKDAVDVAAKSAQFLKHLRVVPGDRVMVVSQSRLEVIELWLGCLWLGAVFVPIDPALSLGRVQERLDSCEPAVVAVDEPGAELLTACLHNGASVNGVVTLVPSLQVSGEYVKTQAMYVLEGVPPVEAPFSAVRETMTAIIFTSGTSGASKGVCIPHGQMFWYGVNTADALELTHDDVLYTCLPVFHINALNTFVQALSVGATYYLGPRFSASCFWERLRDAHASVTYLIGAMVHILEAAPRHQREGCSSLRIALAPGGAPDVRVRFMERFGCKLVDGFGMTETNLIVHSNFPGHEEGTMGRPLSNRFETCVADEYDDEVPPGEVGELLVRPKEPFSIFTGYWRNAQATANCMQNLWFHTGDLVSVTSNGEYRFMGRTKDMIRRRGENISTYEMESTLGDFPGVSEVAVVGVPSPLFEEDVKAFLVLSADTHFTSDLFFSWCRNNLSQHEQPKYVEIVDHLPKTKTHKVQKQHLRDIPLEQTEERMVYTDDVCR